MYDGPEGREYGRQTAIRSAGAAEDAASVVLRAVPRLEKLFIGRSGGEILELNGTVGVVWPWTGRMDEWADDMFPERDEYHREL